MDTSNSHDAPQTLGPFERRLINPYVDAADKTWPPEIARFELETDPYRNLLPGMSNVAAAKIVGGGLRAGRTGNRLLLLVSLFLVGVLVLPALAAVIAQLVH